MTLEELRAALATEKFPMLHGIRADVTAQDVLDALAALEAEVARLREALRWRKWPDEEPADTEFVVMLPRDYPDGPNVVTYTADRQEWQYCEDESACDEGDQWLPLAFPPEVTP